MHQRFHCGIEQEGFNKQRKMVGVKNIIYNQKRGNLCYINSWSNGPLPGLVKNPDAHATFSHYVFFLFFTSKMRCFSSLSDKNDGL